MTQFTIQDKLEAQYVKRWVIIHTTKEQSVAEHSFNVAHIAIEICRRIGADKDTENEAMRYALEHDLYEVFTGDIPKNAKNMIKEATGYNVPDLIKKPGRLAERVVKAADIIETTSFIYFHGQDTQRGKQVAAALVDTIYDKITEACIRSQVVDAAVDICREIMSAERSWKC